MTYHTIIYANQLHFYQIYLAITWKLKHKKMFNHLINMVSYKATYLF